MKTARALYTFRASHRPQTRYIHPVRPRAFLESHRQLRTSSFLQKTQTHTLSDIGEGVKEVQIIQWFVEEGAAVEEWAPLCEVQSDKASVEITSKYTGIVKKLHFDRDAIVQVGDVMLDIEVEGEELHEADAETEPAKETVPSEHDHKQESQSNETAGEVDEIKSQSMVDSESAQAIGRHSGLATPAVRALLREHKIDIAEIEGTGKDGRVLKEDVYKHVEGDNSADSQTMPDVSKPELNATQTETIQSLTPIQSAMFKSMTKSLSIPHFLYSDSINVTSLAAMRSRLNASRQSDTVPKLSYLPFIIKALSLAMNTHPILNARLDTETGSSKPNLVLRSSHNIGIAMDTPSGLLVPVIKNVNARSITSIAHEIGRLSQLGQAGKLSSSDLGGGTITVSNIGNIGGEVVGPVIVEGQLAIMGIGRIKATPVFGADGITVERADLMSTSWSADHRAIDGATMARAARLVQSYLEQPETMMINMS